VLHRRPPRCLAVSQPARSDLISVSIYWIVWLSFHLTCSQTTRLALYCNNRKVRVFIVYR